jgi:TonB family protein
MKKSIIALTALGVFICIQSCAPKKEAAAEEKFEQAPLQSDVKPTLTVAEKRVILEKKKEQKAAERKAAFDEKLKAANTYKEANGTLVYLKAEIDPMYVGGDEAMNKFLNATIKYPKEASENQIEGTVFVDFIISETGSIREVVVTDAPGEDVDQSLRDEAVRVVTAMPKWKPGKQHGKPVEVSYSLPITFRLD